MVHFVLQKYLNQLLLLLLLLSLITNIWLAKKPGSSQEPMSFGKDFSVEKLKGELHLSLALQKNLTDWFSGLVQNKNLQCTATKNTSAIFPKRS